ncbi:hypothetical protein GPECTOR_32g484 [Gonium pectorale]|uniref:Guanylate cyclase domain-containing protein n=1 Tax=Gonium pectorale TaxID=33097 RepID=A0A150GDD6_GONPE|nr:hypothetical protein GPECTOR_32g484 [Gonium pectorale]|eukprot:KXZ47871.1 hypothetical protein GPECTOR_32g484 [Gonium pectorale]
MLVVLQAHAALQEAATVSSGFMGPAASLPRYGLCLTTNPNCGRLGDVLAAIAASIVQPGGTQQGYVFDLAPEPPSAVPLVNSTGWRYAADLLRRMLVYNAPNVQTAANDRPCWGVHPAFLEGDCLFTLEWDAALPSMAVPALQRPGALGVAPLPGSRLVMDRSVVAAGGTASSSGMLVPCTRELCAISVNHDLLYLRPNAYDAVVSANYLGKIRLGPGGLAAIVASTVVSLAIAAVVLQFWHLHRRRRWRHRDFLGRVLAPRAGPDTTLLITDVQNSTVLWEQLPVAVMDATLKLHHGTVRRVLAEYDGYESATEGDSFIVAFMDPASAVAFAATCQVALLLEDWPQELLAHADAAPVLVLPDDAGDWAADDMGLPAAHSALKSAAGAPGDTGGGFLVSSGPDTLMTATWGEALAAVFPRLTPSPDLPSPAEGAEVQWNAKFGAATVVLSSGRLALVAYRGLRVRMGLHSGLDDPQHVAFNQVSSAFKYYGPFAETAKLVSDAAPGGMITLSSQAFAQLRNSMQRGTTATARVAKEALVVYAGRHVLSQAGPPGQDLPTGAAATTQVPASVAVAVAESTEAAINAAGPSPVPSADGGSDFICRVAGTRSGCGSSNVCGRATGAVSSSLQVRLDRAFRAECSRRLSSPLAGTSHTASAGRAAAEVIAEDEDAQPLYVAVHASLLCRLALSPPLRSVRVTELGSLAAPIGCITVAFMKVVGASTLLADLPGPASRALDQFVRLACGLLGGAGGYLVEGGDGLLLAAFGASPAAVEWALDCVEGLKELEEVVPGKVLGNNARQLHSDGDITLRRQLTAIQRGLRIKVGLAEGNATHMLTEASGRLSYRGRVMNRAARIAGIAAAGQVLCSGTVWEACGHQPGFGERVCGVSLGRMSLKGISNPIEVVQCHRELR